jgi:uncharacterized OsmC-like protein
MDEGRENTRDSNEHAWSVRVRGLEDQESRVYAGKNVFSVGRQASFKQDDAHPSAVEYLLGALGGDLVSGFQRQAAKQGVPIDTVESVVTGRLDNPLVFLGVVGAEGNPGFASIAATLYVTSDAEETPIEEIWRATLAASPLVNTLERCVALSLHLQVTP